MNFPSVGIAVELSLKGLGRGFDAAGCGGGADGFFLNVGGIQKFLCLGLRPIVEPVRA